MPSHKRIFSLLLLSVIPILSLFAVDIRWKNQNADTLLLNNVLQEARGKEFQDPGLRVSFFAKRFLGTPYAPHTLEGEKEMLTINTSELDCTTLVDLVLALASASYHDVADYHNVSEALENMRYHAGKIEDYASRLHYNSDWAAENIRRGNIIDITPDLPNCRYIDRTLNFMTTHRSLYHSLKDSVQYAKVTEIEKDYRNYKIPYIPTVFLSKSEIISSLKEGDIIGFAINRNDLDMAHLGILIYRNGAPYILHASSSHGKVEISKLALQDFVKNNKKWIGIRVYRLRLRSPKLH